MTDTSYKEARAIISDAIDALEEAKRNVTTSDEQLVLQSLIEDLRKERIAIDTASLGESNEVYVSITSEINDAKQKLDELTDEIKDIIKAAETAARVVGALTKLIQFAGRFL